jgi:stress-induced morphogen
MACEILKQKIHDTLKSGYFSDSKDFVDVSDGSADHVHIVIVSRKFNGHTMGNRSDIIWDELTKHLSQEEWGNVFLSIGMLPEEIQI